MGYLPFVSCVNYLHAVVYTQTELEPGGDEIPKHLDYYETHQTYYSEI